MVTPTIGTASLTQSDSPPRLAPSRPRTSGDVKLVAVVGLTDPCPVHALLVHLGESRPQPLDTVPFSRLSKVARRLPVLFSNPRWAHHVVPGPCPASVDSKCNEGRSRWETFEFQLRTCVCIYTMNEMYAELYNMATVSRLQLFRFRSLARAFASRERASGVATRAP